MRRRRDVEVTSTPKSDVFITSGYRRCIDAANQAIYFISNFTTRLDVGFKLREGSDQSRYICLYICFMN